MNANISSQKPSYFKQHLKNYQYQRLLSIRGKSPFSFSELQVLSACHYSKYPPSNNYLVKLTKLDKKTVLKSRKALIDRDLITTENVPTDTFNSLSCLVRKSTGKHANWKLFQSQELTKLESRVFSFLVSLENDGIIKKSIGSISRLCLTGNRNKTRLTLLSLTNKGLIDFSNDNKRKRTCIKLLSPPKCFWTQQEKQLNNVIQEVPKLVPDKELSTHETLLAAQLEARKWICDVETGHFSDFTRQIFDFYRKNLNFSGEDSRMAAIKISNLFADYFYKNNALEHTIYYSNEEGGNFAKKIISKFDAKFSGNRENYFKSCIQNIKL